MSPSARGILAVLLHLLHLGGAAGLHGGSLCSARLQRPGHRKQGKLRQLCRAGAAWTLDYLAAVEGRSQRCIRHRLLPMQFLSPRLEPAQH